MYRFLVLFDQSMSSFQCHTFKLVDPTPSLLRFREKWHYILVASLQTWCELGYDILGKSDDSWFPVLEKKTRKHHQQRKQLQKHIMYLDLPRGAKWFCYRVSINQPLGFNWHPLKGAGTLITYLRCFVKWSGNKTFGQISTRSKNSLWKNSTERSWTKNRICFKQWKPIWHTTQH